METISKTENDWKSNNSNILLIMTFFQISYFVLKMEKNIFSTYASIKRLTFPIPAQYLLPAAQIDFTVLTALHTISDYQSKSTPCVFYTLAIIYNIFHHNNFSSIRISLSHTVSTVLYIIHIWCVQLHVGNEHAESETNKKELDNSVKVGVGREYSHTSACISSIWYRKRPWTFFWRGWTSFRPLRHVLLLCVISGGCVGAAHTHAIAIVLTFDDAGWPNKNLIMTGWGLLGVKF